MASSGFEPRSPYLDLERTEKCFADHFNRFECFAFVKLLWLFGWSKYMYIIHNNWGVSFEKNGVFVSKMMQCLTITTYFLNVDSIPSLNISFMIELLKTTSAYLIKEAFCRCKSNSSMEYPIWFCLCWALWVMQKTVCT